MFDVEFFQEDDGSYPVEEFILSLDLKMRAKVFRTLELLEYKGNDLREPFSKHLGEGIFELRVKQSSNIVRILYFFVIGKRIILANGFVKKSQKTPPGEIDLAKKRRDKFIGGKSD